jgi:hypothetical protein
MTSPSTRVSTFTPRRAPLTWALLPKYLGFEWKSSPRVSFQIRPSSHSSHG